MESGMNLRSGEGRRFTAMSQDSNAGASWTVENSASIIELRTIVAGFAAQSLHAFTRDDRRHDKCGGGIGPPPAQQLVQQQSGQKNGREIRAKIGLARIGPQRAA